MSICFWEELVDVETDCLLESGWDYSGSLFYELPEYQLDPPPGAPPGSEPFIADMLLDFNPPSVVKTNDGRIHVAVATNQASGTVGNVLPTYIAYYYSDDNGNSWNVGEGVALTDPPKSASTHYSNGVEPIALITDGVDVYIVQSASSPISVEAIATWKLAGSSWTHELYETLGMSIVTASLAPSGDIYALGWGWGDHLDSDRAYIAVSSDEGATWDTYPLDTGWEASGTLLSASMVFDDSGLLHILMPAIAEGDIVQSVLYYRPTSATSWASAYELLSGSSEAGMFDDKELASQLLIDSSGSLYALYMIDYYIGDKARGIYFAKSSDGGMSWDHVGSERPLEGQVVSDVDDIYGLGDGEINGFHAVITDNDEIHVIAELGFGSEHGVYWVISTDRETFADPVLMQHITGTKESRDDPGYESYSEPLGKYHDDHAVGGYYGLPWTVEISGGIIHVLFNRTPDFDVTYNDNIGTVVVADEPPVINYIKYVVR